MNNKVIHEFDRNSAEKIRFSLNSYQGSDYADVRIYYQTDDGEWRPTKRGVNVHIELLADLYQGIRKLDEAINGRG